MKDIDIASRAAVCPACNAQVGEPCSQPTDTGRKPVQWSHYSRHAAWCKG